MVTWPHRHRFQSTAGGQCYENRDRKLLKINIQDLDFFYDIGIFFGIPCYNRQVKKL